MKQLLKDPLSQFLIVGALLWLGYAFLAPPSDEFRINVPANLEGDAKTAYIEREILLREARRFGLDQNDSIVERQLEQKMRLLLEASAEHDLGIFELNKWIQANAENYMEPSKFSVDYRLFRRSEFGPNAETAAIEFHSTATTQQGTGEFEQLNSQSQLQLRKQLGKVAAESIAQAEGEHWQPPISSGLGWLVFRITHREATQLAAFEKVKKRALVDWIEAQERQAFEEGMQQLQKRYVVSQ